MQPSMGTLTQRIWQQLPQADDPTVRDRIIVLAYERLQVMACQRLGRFAGLRGRTEPDSVVHEGFEAFRRAVAGVDFRSPRHFWNTMGLVIVRQLQDRCRRQERRPEAAVTGVSEEALGQVETAHEGPPERVIQDELWVRLADLIETLPELLREIFVQRAIWDRPNPEIADCLKEAPRWSALNLDAQQVGQRYWRARQILIGKLGEELPDGI
jgi:DNA-directed RNA polymerase specialized sigma24 family protein